MGKKFQQPIKPAWTSGFSVKMSGHPKAGQILRECGSPFVDRPWISLENGLPDDLKGARDVIMFRAASFFLDDLAGPCIITWTVIIIDKDRESTKELMDLIVDEGMVADAATDHLIQHFGFVPGNCGDDDEDQYDHYHKQVDDAVMLGVVTTVDPPEDIEFPEPPIQSGLLQLSVALPDLPPNEYESVMHIWRHR